MKVKQNSRSDQGKHSSMFFNLNGLLFLMRTVEIILNDTLHLIVIHLTYTYRLYVLWPCYMHTSPLHTRPEYESSFTTLAVSHTYDEWRDQLKESASDNISEWPRCSQFYLLCRWLVMKMRCPCYYSWDDFPICSFVECGWRTAKWYAIANHVDHTFSKIMLANVTVYGIKFWLFIRQTCSPNHDKCHFVIA